MLCRVCVYTTDPTQETFATSCRIFGFRSAPRAGSRRPGIDLDLDFSLKDLDHCVGIGDTDDLSDVRLFWSPCACSTWVSKGPKASSSIVEDTAAQVTVEGGITPLSRAPDTKYSQQYITPTVRITKKKGTKKPRLRFAGN